LLSLKVGFVRGAGVEFLGDKAEEFTEVGAGPAFDGLRQSFWNHVRTAFILEINAAAHTEKGDAFFPRPFHDEPQR
jgi:hypothetical protein